MFYAVKATEIRRQLDYVRREIASLLPNAYQNQAGRLQLLQTTISQIEPRLTALETNLAVYLASPQPPISPWRQLFGEMQTLASEVHWLRTEELPSYLAAGPTAYFISNILGAVHQEVGLNGVYPVATLHHAHWFAVSVLSDYPLYYVPASVSDDPGELALIYHEIGHYLFRSRSPAFSQQIDSVISKTVQRKQLEAAAMPDPNVRQDCLRALPVWTRLAANAKEELVCDVVGSLMGGTAFVAALTLGLATTRSPFDDSDAGYPPLDCRMRVGGIVMRYLGISDQVHTHLESGWQQARSLEAPNRLHAWLYDDSYLEQFTDAVAQFLTMQGFSFYAPGCGGIREQLQAGAAALFGPASAYQGWAQSLACALHRDYWPSP